MATALRRSTPLIAILALGLALKITLLVMGALPFNSDEAVIGLMARHILQGERPVFFYGQAYMGSLDAWLVAGMFAVFGPSVTAIRVVQMALFAKRAENDFVGAPVGVMDQMACTLASDGEALFLDTRSLEWKVVPLPASAELIVFNSGIAHNHSKGDYRTRRAEFDAATAFGPTVMVVTLSSGIPADEAVAAIQDAV